MGHKTSVIFEDHIWTWIASTETPTQNLRSILEQAYQASLTASVERPHDSDGQTPAEDNQTHSYELLQHVEDLLNRMDRIEDFADSIADVPRKLNHTINRITAVENHTRSWHNDATKLTSIRDLAFKSTK
jgi:hypothetical protein